jgi:hypothetical protein
MIITASARPESMHKRIRHEVHENRDHPGETSKERSPLRDRQIRDCECSAILCALCISFYRRPCAAHRALVCLYLPGSRLQLGKWAGSGQLNLQYRVVSLPRTSTMQILWILLLLWSPYCNYCAYIVQRALRLRGKLGGTCAGCMGGVLSYDERGSDEDPGSSVFLSLPPPA